MKLMPIISELINEGLNLPSITPVGFAKNLIRHLVNKIEPDPDNNNWINYYDKDGDVVMDYCNGCKHTNGWFAISYEKIYNPIQHRFPDLHNYELVAPIIKQALESITDFNVPEINFIHNVGAIESKHHRRNI